MTTARFPALRLRRLRSSQSMRRLVRETDVAASDFIYPVFARYGYHVQEEIPSMPGQYRWSVDMLPRLAEEARERGLGGVLLFGIPETKDEQGTEAWR